MWTYFFVLLSLISLARSDTPSNCSYDEIKGDWIFYETERTFERDLDCDKMGPPIYKKRISLMFPNVAVDEYGNRGTWTMVYNQGFEVRVTGRSYFAFSYYAKQETNSTDYVCECDKTLNGWSRDVTIRNWSCYYGKKVTSIPKKQCTSPFLLMTNKDRKYVPNQEFVDKINSKQSMWKAKIYPELQNMTLEDIYKRSGGQRVYPKLISSKKPSGLVKFQSLLLPESFDWRNVSGVNYVSDIRSQGNCGSCYAFASMAALESRVRILTKNEQQPVFSPQDIVGCSKLSQGCSGGFPYLIAGRYGQEQGVVEESCDPYKGEDGDCTTNKLCARHYTAYYRYVGGYFGACNEEEMMLAIVRGGPIAVGVEVYNDFLVYTSGIYHHTGFTDKFNPLELTNHAVLAVGYGATDQGEKYWNVKNSWGEGWGENGYVRIRRGTDEISVESLALEVVPVP